MDVIVTNKLKKMKKIILGLICVYGINNMATAQPNMKRDPLNIKHQQAFDSLTNKSIDFAVIKEKYKNPFKQEYEKMNFPKEEIILSNGITAKFQTSDNKKVKDALSQLFTISPADFLIMLRNIHGRIEMKATINQWVTYKDIPFLLKLATVDVVVPDIAQDVSAYVAVTKERTDCKKASMAINAMKLISSYLQGGLFPYSEDAICSYESVKTWYDSGKPASDYKFSILYPIMGLHPTRMQPVESKPDKKKDN
jgi:hypothetical protein